MLGRKILFITLFLGIIGLPITTKAVNYSGSYNVGTAGTWTNLTNAFTAISAGTVTGNISLILVAGYPAAAETYPIVPSTNNSSYTISIYPGTTGLSITSASATGTINLNGCSNYVIDGRVNQAGAENLIVANTSVAGYVIQFINDADNNTIQYCNIEGVNTTLTSGDILFSTAAATGNNNNTIQNCDIHNGATNPYVGICSIGTNTVGQYNSSNTVANCNIYNFFGAASNAYGIYLGTGNTSWTLSGNSLYQTAARVPTASVNLKPIYLNNTGTGFMVSGNYIGGSAASCGGGALSFDAGSTQDSYFLGIYVNIGTNISSTVENNTIANIAYGAKSAVNIVFDFLGIDINSGYVIVSGNTIGSGTGNGSITIAYSAAQGATPECGGIVSNGPAGSISSNTIGSITVSGSNSAAPAGFGCAIIGIECGGNLTSDFVVNNNIVGSTTTSNSIQYLSNAVKIEMGGIAIESLELALTINLIVSGNTVENIANYSTTGTATVGIAEYQTTCVPTVTNNTVAYITTTISAAGGVWAIADLEATASVHTISNNIVHDINNTYAGATTVDNYGIYFNGPTGTSNVISANTIYNLGMSSASTASDAIGIGVLSGAANVFNNMVTLGTTIATGYIFDGIYQTSNTAGSTFYYNSVYIGGTPAAGSNTNAYYSTCTAAKTIKNNIFYNARSGFGKHYSITVTNNTGLTTNYNDLISATDVGDYTGTTEVSLANWQAASSQDANSISSNPTFVSTATPDLHITSGSSVITKGTSIAAVTIDFDNELRSSTPDIGADEYHTNYYSTSSGNLDVLTNWGLNTDGTGANPANFTTRDQTFNIRNNATPTIGATWAVSGSGSLVILGDATNPCNFTIPALYNLTGATLNISNNGTLTNQNAANPTFGVINSGSTVNYNSASGVAQTIANATYGNLIISNSTGSGSSTKSLATNISTAGNLTVNGYATMDMVTFNANRTGGGGTLTLAANSTLRLSGTTGGPASTSGGTTSFPKNYATTTFNSSSTIEYYGATQTIYDLPTYGNITFTTAGTKTAGGALTIAGSVLINPSATFNASTYSHTVGGNWTNNTNAGGLFTPSTGTIIFNGTSGQIINGNVATQTFYNVIANLTSGQTLSTGGSTVTLTTQNLTETSGNITAPATLNINGNLLLTAGALTAGTTINIKGNWTNNGGTFTLGTNIVNFTGAAAQTINGTASSQTFYNVVANLTAGQLLSTGGSTTTLTTNNLTEATGNVTAPATLYINGNLTLTAGTFTAGTTISIQGNWTNNGGTFTPGTNVVNFIGTTAQTINGTAAAQTFYNLVGNLTAGQLLTTGGSTVTLTTQNLTETTGNVTAPATLTINGNLTLTAGTFTAGAALNVLGNFLNNSGNFIQGTNTVSLKGGAAQTLGGTSPTTFYNLTINNTSGGVTLGAAESVTNTLTLTSGIVTTTATDLLTLIAGSTSSVGSATTYVNGPMAKVGTTAFTFPLGNNGVWARLGIGAPSASETFTAQYVNSGYGSYAMAAAPIPVLNNVSIVEYWTLGRAGAANTTVTLYSENSAASGISLCSNTDLRIAHYNTVSNKWENNNNAVTVNLTAGTCGTATGKVNITTNAVVTNFSPFTFGSLAGSNPLPVELTSFTAQCNEGDALLQWTTATESNNKFFTVEKTQDGLHYNSAAVVTGNGTTDTEHNYTVMDPTPFSGLSYYRLSQTDFDGNTTYFNSIPFESCGNVKDITAFVNSSNDINIHINSTESQTYAIEIINLLGQTIVNTNENVSKGSNQFTFPNEYDKGVYFIRVSNPYTTYTTKVLILK